jgi:GT2 family glycosyltransferase
VACTVAEIVPVSIVIPTIGRMQQLRACLESLTECRPRAAEVLVVDQSGGAEVERLVRSCSALEARTIECSGRGIALAMNVGLRAAEHDIILVTHDDCTVAPSWIGTGWKLMAPDPRWIVTGRVLPVGDPNAVPSTKDDPNWHDYTGEVQCAVLFPNNMALNRAMVLALGGFDERFKESAEDNDLCYRWLRAGNRMRYEPEFVVWHHDWRSEKQLKELYVRYGEGQGRFYAKHLRSGDLTMLRFLAYDLRAGAVGVAAAVWRRRRLGDDPERRMLRGLPVGLLKGWREFEPRRKRRFPRAPRLCS